VTYEPTLQDSIVWIFLKLFIRVCNVTEATCVSYDCH